MFSRCLRVLRAHYGTPTTSDSRADITAKTGSQMITASLCGMGAGCILSPLVGSDTATIAPVLACLSAGHLCCVYRGLSFITLNTFNAQRADIVLSRYCRDSAVGVKSGAGNTIAEGGGGDSDPDNSATAPRIVLTPEQVAPLEVVIGTGKGTADPGLRYLVSGRFRPDRERCVLTVGADFASVGNEVEPFVDPEGAYVIALEACRLRGGGAEDMQQQYALSLWFEACAADKQMLTGLLHATHARDALNSGTGQSDCVDVLNAAGAFAAEHGGSDLAHELEAAGWKLDPLFVEDEDMRRFEAVIPSRKT